MLFNQELLALVFIGLQAVFIPYLAHKIDKIVSVELLQGVGYLGQEAITFHAVHIVHVVHL